VLEYIGEKRVAAPPRSGQRRQWIPTLVVGLLVSIAAGYVSLELAAISTQSPRLPRWDMAGYGVRGVWLAEALKQGDLLRFFSRINQMAVKPPVFPLLECPVLLAFGYDYSVPRGLTAVLFFLCVLAIYWIGWELAEPDGHLAGGIAASLMCTSPMFLQYGTHIMLEIPGALLLLVALGFYLRFLKTGGSTHLTLACLSGTALFLCKYNYGLMWMVPVLLNEIWRSPGARSWLASDLPKWARSGGFLRPFRVFLIAYAAFLVAIAVTGGWVWRIGGREISIRSLGNPVYLLIIMILVRLAIRPRQGWRRVRDVYVGVDRRLQRFVVFFIAPIFLWLMVPSHMKNFFYFLRNRDSNIDFFTAENFLYYPRAFVAEYSCSTVVGIVVLVLALASLAKIARAPSTQRILCLALVCGLLVLTGHRLKGARFALTTLPLLWLSGALFFTQGLSTLLSRLGTRGITVGMTLLALLGPGLVLAEGFDRDRIGTAFRSNTVSESVRPVLDAIADAAWDARGTRLLGTWNNLSPGLVEWHCRLRRPGLDPIHIPEGRGKLGDGTSPLRVVEGWAQRGQIEDLLVLKLPKDSPEWTVEFERDNSWLPPIRSEIEASPKFELEDEQVFPDSGYRLLKYRVASGSMTPHDT
jgi:hypothetical protein